MTESIINGPWDIFQSDPDDTYCLTYQGNEFAYINKDQEDVAFVMLAAPDLLKALNAVLQMPVKGHDLQDRMQFTEEGRRVFALATAAIAKAKGEGEMDVVLNPIHRSRGSRPH